MAYFPGTQSFRQSYPRNRTRQGGNNRRAVNAYGLPNIMARGMPVPGRGAGNRIGDGGKENGDLASPKRSENWLANIQKLIGTNMAPNKMMNAFSGIGTAGGGSPEILNALSDNPMLARKVQAWWEANRKNYGAWGNTVYGDIGANGVWDQGEFSGVPGIQRALFQAFPRLARAYGDPAYGAPEEQGSSLQRGRSMGAGNAEGPQGTPGSNAALQGQIGQAQSQGQGQPMEAMADEYRQALARMGLPLDPIFEQFSNRARSARDVSLMNVENAYDVGTAQAGLQNTLAHRGIDENAAARGLFGSGIERRNERIQNTDYNQGLLSLLQQKQLGTQQAYASYADQMQQAILDLANRQMQDPYSAVPNYYDWQTGQSEIANQPGGSQGSDRLARLRQLLQTGDLTNRQRQRVRTRIQGLR